MAHKELITQYAKQLTEANQRIIDLEVNIADVRSELDKANASENHPRDDDKKEIERLRKELAAKEGATEDLRNATKHTSEQPVDIEDAPPAGEIERSDEDESKKARERIVELELAIQSKSKKIANVKKRVGNDQKELRTRGEKIAELEEQIKDVNARNRVLGGEKGRLTARVNWLTGMKEQAAESRQKATELQAQVDDLNKQLNQEGKRKREPEDGEVTIVKRCQRCSPVVINLLEHEEDGDGKADSDDSDASETKATAVVQRRFGPTDSYRPASASRRS